MQLQLSFIIPVYDRPDEIKELLESFAHQDYKGTYEIVIIEDGSSSTAAGIIKDFNDQLNITYLEKENTGPGDSRNYGMKRASGTYFIILDSDCVLPEHYIRTVIHSLEENYVDCFGGPDAAQDSFSSIQRAINYSTVSYTHLTLPTKA